MSLKLWLPLNGNTENKGIIVESMTGSPNSWTDGKIAKCATFNTDASNVIICNSEELKLGQSATDNFSYCMWLKKTSAASGSMWLFSVSKAALADAGYGYGLKVINNNGGLRFYFGSKTYDKALEDDEWHHIAFVKSGTDIKIYLDGVQTGSATFSGTYPSYSSYFGFALGGYRDRNGSPYISNPLNGSVSDFRIYDHALSLAEIIEIKKAMIFHYSMDNQYATGNSNLYSDSRAQGDSSSSTFTKTKLINEDGYNFSLTYTGTGSSYYPNIKFPTISRTLLHPGKKYTWSAKIRVNTWTSTSGTPRMDLRSSIKSNDTTNGSVRAAQASYADGQWRTISRTITLTEGMLVGSTYYYITTEAYNASTETSKAYMSPLVEFYTNNLSVNGAVYTFNFDLKEIQIIESNEFPGWIDNNLVTNQINDSSGFGYNGFATNTISTSTNTPRNSKCYEFDGNSYITGAFINPIVTTMNEFTMSFWVYLNNTQLQTIFSEIGTNFKISISSTQFYVCTTRTGTTAFNPTISMTINEWHQVTVTMKDNLYKLYIDGTQVASSTVSTNLNSTSIGCYFCGDSNDSTKNLNGKLSDLRIYATELTANQVKELYNTPISLYDNGILKCQELVNDDSKSFSKEGIINGQFNEAFLNETYDKLSINNDYISSREFIEN